MTLRKKTLLIFGGIFLCGIPIVLFVLWSILLQDYTKLENDIVLQNLERATNALNISINSLGSTAGDWASWDDTYDFVDNLNNQYVTTNLVDGTFTGLQLNFVLFFDNSGKLVYTKAFDLQAQKGIYLPGGIKSFLFPDGELTNDTLINGVEGIVLISGNPVIIASRPILTSEEWGPRRGTLIMGHYLNNAAIQELSERTQLRIAISKINDPQIMPVLKTGDSILSKDNPVVIQPLNKQSIAGYQVLTDVYGNAALLLRVDMLREIYNQSLSTFLYVSVVIAALVIMCALIVWYLMQKNVISRVTTLGDQVAYIGRGSDFSARVFMSGRDELSDLTETINHMLGALQKSDGKLRESEQYYRSIFETAGAAMAIIDENNLLSLVNSEFAKLSGYSKAELEGKRKWNQFVELQIIKDMRETLTHLMISPRNYECTFVNRKGNIRGILLNISMIPGTKMFVSSIIDITERKKAEIEIKTLYSKEAELRQKLESEMKSRVEFTRALVHELKTPLTPLLTSSDMLKTELKEEPLSKMANNINRGAKRLDRRIDELLDLARGEIGMLKLNVGQVDPAQMLQDVVDEIIPLALRRHQSIVLDLPHSLPPVQADEDRLKQVISNILNNAVKFTHEGKRITVRASENGSVFTVEVQDEGPGITAEVQKMLFRPYYRGENEKNKPHGLGLGLALCKMLIELHGGQVWVTSDVDKGSIFGFSIPIKPLFPKG